jgi:hypothetical protein
MGRVVDVNGWVRGGPTGLRWHQAEYDSRTGTATLACSGKVVTPGDEVMDYRWTPPWDQHCLWHQCQAEVQP